MRSPAGFAVVILSVAAAALAGCTGGHAVRLGNPLAVPGTTLATAEKVSQRVLQELRFQIVYPRIAEGRIETGPVTGASWFEFWREDTARDQRLESSLHTTRRRVAIAISPKETGVEILVKAAKQRLSAPGAGPMSLGESVGAHTARDRSLLSRWDDLAPTSYEWIDMGRDEDLEQLILGRVQRSLASGAVAK